MKQLGFADDVGHNTLLIIITCGLMLFMTLGSSEVQSWDESLYATRARAVIEHEAWWDQSSYALGGMYSATYPPLSVWGMALCMKVLKQSVVSVRLFSVLCACASLFLIHAIALFLTSRKNAMLAPPLLSASLVWNHYARQGMSDVPLMCWSLLALLAVLKIRSLQAREMRAAWTAVLALSCAAALMTKIIVSFIPVFFVIILVIDALFARKSLTNLYQSLLSFSQGAQEIFGTRRLIAVGVLFGILLALPWHISMMQMHPGEFIAGFGLPHIRAVVENNARPLGALYYVNQLIVTQPLIVFAFAWCVLLFRHRREFFVNSHDAAVEVLLGLWFVLGLIVLSSAPTKNPHYTLLILPPAILLSMRGMELLTHFSARQRSAQVVMNIVLVATIWTMSQQLRDQVQLFFSGQFHVSAIVFLILVVLLFAASMRITIERRLRLYQWQYRAVRLVIPVILILRVAFLNVWGNDTSRSASAVAKWLEDSQSHEFVYVVHAHNSSDTLAPQLSWYTKGWAGFTGPNPWREDRGFRYITLPESASDSTLSAIVENITVPIVYAIPSDTAIANAESHRIARVQRTRLQTRHYIIFSRRSYSNTDPVSDASVDEQYRESMVNRPFMHDL